MTDNPCPIFFKLNEHEVSLVNGRGAINLLQISGHFFLQFPGGEVQAVADHVDDAQLNDCFRVDRLEGFREAFQPVDTGDKDVLHAAILELGDHLQPEFGTLGLVDPHAQNFLVPIHGHADRQIDGLVDCGTPPRNAKAAR